MNIRQFLEARVEQAMQAAGAAKDSPAVIKPSGRPEFGDYQANGVMGAAKKLKMNPRELATKVVEHLDLQDIASNIEIAGPGLFKWILIKPGPPISIFSIIGWALRASIAVAAISRGLSFSPRFFAMPAAPIAPLH